MSVCSRLCLPVIILIHSVDYFCLFVVVLRHFVVDLHVSVVVLRLFWLVCVFIVFFGSLCSALCLFVIGLCLCRAGLFSNPPMPGHIKIVKYIIPLFSALASSIFSPVESLLSLLSGPAWTQKQ